MKLDQAIQTAIQYETKVRDVYRQAQKKIKGLAAQKVLTVLAHEEQQHLDYLQNRLSEWKSQGKISLQALSSKVPSKPIIQASVDRLRSQTKKKSDPSDLIVLKEALEMEKETSDFYQKMVRELDSQGKSLFEKFLAIEDGHLTLVQAEIDNLQGLGFWLDFQEFDLEAG